MIKKILTSAFFIFLFFYCHSQATNFTISLNEDEIKGRNIMGYYDEGSGNILINTQKRDSITHLFFDSSFNFQKEYTVNGDDRSLLYAMYGPGKKQPYFAKNFSVQNAMLEVYASKDSVFIYKLEPENGNDVKLTGIDLNKKYKDEELVAVMQNKDGCNFLTVSRKNDVAMIYKWQLKTNQIAAVSVELPKSTLSDEEEKQFSGDYLEIKYKTIFSNVSVSRSDNPEIFQFPTLSQLFYDERNIYLVNKIPDNMGIHVFTINNTSGTINSKNYFVNKLPSQTDLDDVASPAATFYDSLLIIQNWSEEKFEYWFYNAITSSLVRQYKVKTGDSIYQYVHSPLKQYGTYGSASGKKQLDNEKRFVRRMENGVVFLKPMIDHDSLVLTFGSFVPTKGAEGLIMAAASVGTGLSMGPIGSNYYFFYYNTERNKFLYGHSKFALNGLVPSSANNISTFLDDFIADSKMDELKDDNSILIATPDKLYVGIYSRKSRLINFTAFRQH